MNFKARHYKPLGTISSLSRITSTMLLLILLAACSQPVEFREYVPLVWDDANKIIEQPETLTKEHLDNLQKVLNYYKVHYKRISPTSLQIQQSVGREMQWNYTSKANDPEWLKEHGI